MNPITEAAQNYKRPTVDLLHLFAGQDVQARDRIRRRLDQARQVDLETATIVIASWENRFAAAGGVRAVTQEYARYLTSKNRTVRVVTPLHMGLQAPPGAVRLASVLWLDFEGVRRRVELFESEWATVKWVFVQCEGFFTAQGGRDRSNPYLYAQDALQGERLVRDGLFYAATLPKALCALGISDNVILHLQDWETAAAALTIKAAILSQEINRAISILAVHNPYDAHLDSEGWAKLTDRPEPENTPPTFLGRMLPLIDAPPATVSREFAKDLTSDPLQTTHFADHLQDQFKRFGIIGVDNGPFETVEPPFSASEISEARAGRPGPILKAKQRLRDTMKRMMAAYRPDERWGDVDFSDLAEDVPVFMCNGRFDPGQKGFDVTARAIELLLDDSLDARFVLTPIVGNAPQPFVDDLRTLAARYVGQVVVYPFRMRRGYAEIQAGCTFSIWPSMYEPFGGVSEFLMRGTPVIARATGGLRQQIKDYDPRTGEGNGILYTTALAAPGSDAWRKIQTSPTPRDRVQVPIYQDQVEQLANAIVKADTFFRDGQTYGRLLSNVPGSVAGYAWSRAAHEYAQIYDIARK